MADNEIYEVEHIVGRRVSEGVVEYLIRWKGFTTDWDTWEPIDNLLDCLQLLQEFEQAVTKKTIGLKTSPTKKNAEEAQRFALDIINKSLKHQAEENEKDVEKKHKSPKTSPKPKKGSPMKSTNTECRMTLFSKSPTSPKKFSSGECLMCCSSDEKAGIKTAISDAVDAPKRSPTKRKPEGLGSPKQPTVKKKKIDKDSNSMSPKSISSDDSAKSSDSKKGGKKTKPESSKKKKVLTKDVQGSGQKIGTAASPKSVTATSPKSAKKFTTNVHKASSKRKYVKKKDNSQKEKTKKQIEKQSLKIAKKVLDKSKAQANKKTTHKKSGIKSKTTKQNGDISDREITFPKLRKPKQKKVASSPDKHSQSSSTEKSIGLKGKKVVVKNKLTVDKQNKTVSKVKKIESETKSKKSDQRELNSKSEQTQKSPCSGSNFSLRINLKSNSKSKPVNLAVKKATTVKSPESTKKKDLSKDKNERKAASESKSKTEKKHTNEDVELIDLDSDEESDVSGDESLYDVALKSAKAKSMAKKPQIQKKASPSGSDKTFTATTNDLLKQPSDIKHSPVDSEESPRKKMRLIDSMKAKKINPVARSVSPTPLFTTVKPLTTSLMKAAASESIAMESLCGDVPTYQYFPAVIPISPSSMSYRMFLENLPHQLHPKQSNKGKKLETGDSPPEEVERRISVRQSECAFRYKEIVVKKCAKYTQIWMNTHTNIKNVLNPQVIQEIVSALNSAKYDDSNLVMFSGLGNVFCNGIDLHYLISGDKRVSARQMVDALRDFTKALITFPKPIVAVVTGSAVGLGMTMLPLCDVVYASDKATFHLPYAQLSQTPEGCATYTLPSTVGMAMANELLIAGRKITAIEACQLGLVSQVFWPTSMMQEVIPRVQNMALLSGKSLETTKLLIRSHQRTKLELTNESESNLLLERWSSFETQKAIENYLNNEKNFTL